MCLSDYLILALSNSRFTAPPHKERGEWDIPHMSHAGSPIATLPFRKKRKVF